MGDYPTIMQNVNGRPIPICHVFEFGKYLGQIDITFKKEGDQLVISDESQFEGKPLLLGKFQLKKRKSIFQMNLSSRMRRF